MLLWCICYELCYIILWFFREFLSMIRVNIMVNDFGESMCFFGVLKLVDVKKWNMDDWCFWIFLEELYKDKKYFDYVIDLIGKVIILFVKIIILE